MNGGPLAAEEWRFIQASVPIACVDVVVWRRPASSNQRDIGLILRNTPHEGQRWCLVGGRLLLDERLTDAVHRQVRDTLTTEPVHVSPQPQHVAEYARTGTGGPHDPRQHAIGMTWAVQLRGNPVPKDEAREFRWFAEGDVPELGFGQQDVLLAVLATLPSGAGRA